MKARIRHLIIPALAFSYLALAGLPAYAEPQALTFNCNPASDKTTWDALEKRYETIYKYRDQAAGKAKTIQEADEIKKQNFCIVKTDLNNDKIDDLILDFNFGPQYCTERGCRVQAYTINDRGNWQEVLEVHTKAENIKIDTAADKSKTLIVPIKDRDSWVNVPYLYDARQKTYRRDRDGSR